MKFEVYCDESRPDLLSSSKPQARYMLIGSIWLKKEDRNNFKTQIHQLKNKHKIGGEFKWQKISCSKKNFYLDLIEWFIRQGENLRFRCIAIDRERVNLLHYHENDQELGFYKFYYQLLHHWILDFNEYSIFCDYKSNRGRDRLHILKRCLELSNLSSNVLSAQSVRSRESVLIQLADFFTGMAASRINNTLGSKSAKNEVTQKFEKHLGKRISHTLKSEQKFNVFVINLHGGW